MSLRKLVILLLAGTGSLFLPTRIVGQASEESCVACHAALSDSRLSGPVEAFADDVHAAEGFNCVSCHGGDAQEAGLAAMDPARGYVGVPSGQEIVTICGRCHSDAEFMRRYNPSLRVDQVAEYRTSVHGFQLFERGDQRVATCASCHPAHSIKPPSDPSSSVFPLNLAETCSGCHADQEYMAPYTLPVDQHEKYQRSVHWRMMSEEGDLSAPTCNDCHGNHGAAPPGVSWVGNVCGQCHTVMASQFNESLHSQIFAMLGNPGCATCHGNHEIVETGDDLLGLEEGAVCSRCHSESSTGGRTATEMRGLIDSLSVEVLKADSILSRAEHAGMEVSQAQFDLNAATTSLVSARTAVHSFSVDNVKEEVEGGLEVTAQAYARGQDAMDELQFRRIGLAVSVSIILVLIVGLVLKIRQLESKPE
jgi:hypothetical protein